MACVWSLTTCPKAASALIIPSATTSSPLRIMRWKAMFRQENRSPSSLRRQPDPGAVIAGGRSSRFGSDKAEALLDGMPLVEHAAAALKPPVDAMVLVGRDRASWLCLHDRPRAEL